MTPFALVLNEFATNAVKHGALSVSEGSVVLETERQDKEIIVRWSEHGGPPVAGVPERHGFGIRLTAIAVENQLHDGAMIRHQSFRLGSAGPGRSEACR